MADCHQPGQSSAEATVCFGVTSRKTTMRPDGITLTSPSSSFCFVFVCTSAGTGLRSGS